MNDDSDDKAKLFVPKDRVFERTQGCWNCAAMAPANEFWKEARTKDLQKAVNIAHTSILGENDPKVVNIRRMVDNVDHQVFSGTVIRCSSNPKGRTARGEPVGDLVAANYLCDRWRGATGASIARAGQKADALPEELADKLDGKPSQDFDDIVSRRLGDDN